MQKVMLYAAVFVLAVLHQDFWLWESKTVVFNFLPAGLAYHVGISICASILWASIVFFAWPTELIEEVEAEQEGDSQA